MASLQILQNYLAAAIPIENPAHGRGTLIGLPYARLGEHQVADVRFEPSTDLGGSMNEDHYELANVVPVLYHPDDILPLVESLHPSTIPAGVATALGTFDSDALHGLAAMIDGLRALGVALNVAPDQYIRRWVHRPVMPTEPQPLAPAAGQLLLF